MSGDLQELYEKEVLDSPYGEEAFMMSVINLMCGNNGLWEKLMSGDEVSFAFELCSIAYAMIFR